MRTSWPVPQDTRYQSHFFQKNQTQIDGQSVTADLTKIVSGSKLFELSSKSTMSDISSGQARDIALVHGTL